LQPEQKAAGKVKVKVSKAAVMADANMADVCFSKAEIVISQLLTKL